MLSKYQPRILHDATRDILFLNGRSADAIVNAAEIRGPWGSSASVPFPGGSHCPLTECNALRSLKSPAKFEEFSTHHAMSHKATAAAMSEAIHEVYNTADAPDEARGELDVALPAQASTASQYYNDRSPPLFKCRTQSKLGSQHAVTAGRGGSKPSRIRLGLYGVIYRWPRSATLWYTLDLRSFPSNDIGWYVGACFEAAATMWHPAPVRFKCVGPGRPATFIIRYRPVPDDGDTRAYADSFFPNYAPVDRRIEVYDWGLQHWHSMVNILGHEIGHILGLRHEFYEPDYPSVQAGPSDPLSAMNYFDDPALISVSELDKRGLRWLYNYPHYGYMGMPVVEVR